MSESIMRKATAPNRRFARLRVRTLCALCCAASLPAHFAIAATPPLRDAAPTATPREAKAWQAKVDPTVLANAALGATEFFVYMAAQADLGGARELEGKEAKSQYVYERLKAIAATTQPPVKQVLDAHGAPYRAFWISNTLMAKGNLAVVQAVAALPEVAAIHAVGRGALSLPPQDAAASAQRRESGKGTNLFAAAEPGLSRVNAEGAWALGYEGQGVVVAGADTGVRFTHQALRNQYRGWGGSAEASSHDYNWHDAIHVPNWPPEPLNACNPGGPAGVGQPSPTPCDDDVLLGGGHGSHTVGSMVGYDGADNRIGLAPQAQWIACRNMSNGVGNVATYLECMEWFLAPTRVDGTGADPAKAPHVINNSWGCLEACPPEPNPLRDSLVASRAAGIVYVASAGNDGPECNTIFHPLARYPEAFTVGSTTHTTDTVSSFSSRGPAAIDPENLEQPLYTKPNISAPGSNIRSALRGSDTEYGSLSGTSMAGPHVAGLVALVISANPALAGDVDRIEDIVEQSAAKKTTTEGCGGDTTASVPNNTYGEGRIDALAAVLLAREQPAGDALFGNGFEAP
ncbi:MAG TPA: S8 family serine peptidase [Xanthomonadales bacterium]|nr:S8 family serine peptidase [Xanthomonadales bacterium]